ncbi:DUF3145 family protein [Streptomyces sp. NPDC102476]|uniref:DUF3145 family protein n=1 Tax=Streptomyces sp. NPDC102476 TaxID=3366181 RepID=UPI0037F8A284
MDDSLPALQITVHATTSSDLPAVLHALNTHHLTTDFTADDTHPLTDLQPGHTYVTRADAATAEHLATALITTAPNTTFELSNDPHETQHGTYIAYDFDAGVFRAQCDADGTPLIPADTLAQALAQVPADLPARTWLQLHAPALLGTDVRAALGRYRTRPRILPASADDHPGHGQTAHCGACGTPITWYFDDPDAGTPYGHWFDSEDRDLCPATDVDADDPGHTPAPAPADFHQAAFYLPPDPAARDESFPITALAGLRIGTYIDDTYTVNIGVLDEDAHPALRTTPDGQLAVKVRIGSHTLHTPAPDPRPGHSFTLPATYIRFTVHADDEAAADTTARSLGNEVHDLATLRRLGIEVTEIAFADASEAERDDTPAHRPDETEDPEWTVTGVRWNESPQDVVALTALPGTHQPAGHDVSDELSGWVRHLRAPDSATALRLAHASAASPEAVAAFRADDNA